MLSMKFHRRVPVAAVVAVAGALFAAAPATASSFQCSASAIRGTVLTQTGLEPVVANGGQQDCQPAAATLNNLPAPLGGWAFAKTDLTGSADAPASQQASAKSGLSSFSVGALRDLPIALPQAQIPDGLNSINIPLPVVSSVTGSLPSVPSVPSVPGVGALPGVGSVLPGTGGIVPPLPTDPTSLLPSAISVDAVDAVKALVPTQQLPDLPLAAVKALGTTLTGQCLDGLPKIVGDSVVNGLQGLGQTLPTDAPIDQVVTLINAQTIPLTGIDLSKVKLPAGLSFDDPVTGPVLKQAVQDALAALPPITVPATVADVQTTPDEQTGDGSTSLEQHALRMRVAVLGQQVANLVMGIARIGTDGLNCGKAVAKVDAAASPAAPVAPASQLAVSCSKQKVTLIDVADAGDHVALFGAADKKYVGRTVRFVFPATGQQVATSKVRPDGFFRAAAPVPSKSIRYSSNARYVALVGGDQSLPLKLHRRMRISRMRHIGNTIHLVGRVYGPQGDAPVTISRRVSCTKDVVVGHVSPDSNGIWRATVKAPKGTSAAVYRATTMVRNMAGSAKTFPTFTLPGYVSL